MTRTQTHPTSTSRPSGGSSPLALLIVLFLAVACSTAPQPDTAARPEEEWIATTCLPASPDTTGWKVHQFSDLEFSLPPEFTVRNRTSRSIEFVHQGSVLSMLVSTSPTRDIFFAAGRPARAKEEAGCSGSLGGYRAVWETTARANRFTVRAEWDSAPLWGADDWRKRLVARITTGSLSDAQRLRDVLHTIRGTG